MSELPTTATVEHPPASLPTIFADGILNLAHGQSVMKCYLGRSDPALRSGGPLRTQVFAQLVMPVSGFLHAFAFFEQQLARLIAAGLIDQKSLDEARRIAAGNAPPVSH